MHMYMYISWNPQTAQVVGAHCNTFLGHEHILGTQLLTLLSTTQIQIPCGHMEYVPNHAAIIVNKCHLPNQRQLVAAKCSVKESSQHWNPSPSSDILTLLSPEICHAVGMLVDATCMSYWRRPHNIL